jgi:diguanylate cyclase (GGDEF)-like protein
VSRLERCQVLGFYPLNAFIRGILLFMSGLAFFYILVGLVCLGVAWYASRWRNLSAAMPLALLLLLASGWCISQGLIVAGVSLEAKIVWMTWHFVFSIFMPVIWLFLVRAVTGLPVKVPRVFAFLVIGFALFSVLVVLTNSAHHLMFAKLTLQPGRMLLDIEYGAFFSFFAVINYAQIILGMVLLVRRWQLERGARRTEMVLWLSCVILPTVADIASFVFPETFKDIEPGPLLFAITALIAAWSLASKRVFRIEPVALELVFESLHDGVLILDRFGRVAQLNSAAKSFANASLKDVIGVPVQEVLKNWTLQTLEPQTLEVNLPNSEKYLEYTLSSLVGGGFVVIVRDVSEVRLYQRSILELGLRDPLTGLANRRAFFDRAEQAIALAKLEHQQVFIAFLDLDDFKPVNDQFGHEQGDVLLREVAARLENLVGTNGLVARVGGDEFVILLEHLDRNQVVALMAAIEFSLNEAFSLNVGTVRIGVSVGLAEFPKDGAGVAALLDTADGEMYKRKQGKSAQPLNAGEALMN